MLMTMLKNKIYILALILAVKVVANIDEAIGHINRFGTRHSETIITKDEKAKAFYLHYGFTACKDRPLTLYLPLGV